MVSLRTSIAGAGIKPGPSFAPTRRDMKPHTKAQVIKYSLQLNTVSDADVIAYLESRENKNDTIRQALLAKMSKEA